MRSLIARGATRLRTYLDRADAPDPGRVGERATIRSMGMRGTVMLGVGLVAFFFGGLGVWAAVAKLESAAIAHGHLVVGSNRKVIQHLEGGIVREILVREGASVEAGDPLVVLEETQPESALGMVRSRLRHAVAREARLIAERDKVRKIRFPSWLTEEASGNPEVAEIVTAQQRIFDSRKEAIDSQIAILKQRIAQYREEIAGLQAEIAAETTQIDLIAREVQDVQFLVNKGLERHSRLLQLQRQAADIEGSRARNRSLIARAKQSIGEAELRILDLSTNFAREVNEELRDAQAEIAELWERHKAAEDVMTRTVIRAPVTGTVVNLKVFTTGGVIAPREPLMEIVPAQDELIVEARIDPNDIDVVHAGLPALVRLTAFTARTMPTVRGTVQTVSADRLVEERSGIAYYTARVLLSKEDRDHLAGVELYPGMPAEVMIIAGERSPLSYLLLPLTSSFNRAMREG